MLLALGFNVEQEPKQTLVDLSQLPEEEQAVMELLAEPVHRDYIIEQLELTPSDANILLMKMEIAGLITETSGDVRRI